MFKTEMCFSINNVVFYQTISTLDHEKCCLIELPEKKGAWKHRKVYLKMKKIVLIFLKKWRFGDVQFRHKTPLKGSNYVIPIQKDTKTEKV